MLSGPAAFPLFSILIELTIFTLDDLPQFTFSSAEARIDWTFGGGGQLCSSLKYCANHLSCSSPLVKILPRSLSLTCLLVCWDLPVASLWYHKSLSYSHVLQPPLPASLRHCNTPFILSDLLLFFSICCLILLLGLCLFSPRPANRLRGSGVIHSLCSAVLFPSTSARVLLLLSLMSFHSSSMFRYCRGWNLLDSDTQTLCTVSLDP